jgi:hypothetical protein
MHFYFFFKRGLAQGLAVEERFNFFEGYEDDGHDAALNDSLTLLISSRLIISGVSLHSKTATFQLKLK